MRRRADSALLALAGLIALYVAVFGVLTWRQHTNFGTFGFDMGIYDQALWLLSRFREPFVTVRGLNYFGHHVNVLPLLFVPAYWLGAGPRFLYLAETVALAAGAIPIFLLAKDRLGGSWPGVALAAAYLLNPSLQWINWWHFHPDALIVAPLLTAYWLSTRRRWGPFACACAAAALAKEDGALAVCALGLLTAAQGDRREGLAAAGAAAAYFALCAGVLIPLANGAGEPLYASLYPDYGRTLGAIVWHMCAHPWVLAARAFEPSRLVYAGKLLAPFGFAPLAAPAALLAAGPQWAANILSTHDYTYDFRFHYSSVLVAAAAAATVEACRASGRAPKPRRALIVWILACAAAENFIWSPSPLSREFSTGHWVAPQARHAVARRALSMIPEEASVTATYWLVPHLTHRARVYEWPNPWGVANWGIRGGNPHDPASVEYLALDTTVNGTQAALYRRLTGKGGDFEVMLDEEGIVLARRVRRGPIDRALSGG